MKHIRCCKFSLYHSVEAVLVVNVIVANKQCKEIPKRKVLFMEDICIDCNFHCLLFLKGYQ